MAVIGSVELLFPEDETVEARALGQFLSLLRATYAVALDEYAEWDLAELVASRDAIRETLRARIAGAKPAERLEWLREDFEDPELEPLLTRASLESPLRLTLRAQSSALVLALILSGGEAELGPLSVKLQPIADGIRALMELFAP